MKKSQKKRDLIYACAGEGVLQARIEVSRVLQGHPLAGKVDTLLAAAMRASGDYAVKAFDADTRLATRASICNQ